MGKGTWLSTASGCCCRCCSSFSLCFCCCCCSWCSCCGTTRPLCSIDRSMTSSSFSGMSTTVSSGLDFLLLVIPAPAFHSVLCRRRSFLTRALKGVIVAFPRLKTEMTRRYFVRSGFRHGAKGASEVTGGIRGREREREKKKRRQTGSRKRGRERDRRKSRVAEAATHAQVPLVIRCQRETTTGRLCERAAAAAVAAAGRRTQLSTRSGRPVD